MSVVAAANMPSITSIALGVGVVAALFNALIAVGTSCFSQGALFGGSVGALLATSRAHLLASSVMVGVIAFIAVLLWSFIYGSTAYGGAYVRSPARFRRRSAGRR